MSCSFRSRNRSASAAARIFSTAPGPSAQNSWRPTFNVLTCGPTACAQRVAVARSPVSNATAIGLDILVLQPFVLGEHVDLVDITDDRVLVELILQLVAQRVGRLGNDDL